MGRDETTAALKTVLIERTGGNPFFLEEGVRTLVETGVLAGDRGAYRLARPTGEIRVPATVQAVLAARIDRLPPEEKTLLQTAAVIGVDLPFALLRAVVDLPEEPLRAGLMRLQGREFLYETRLVPELEYAFKHALSHEVAYAGVPQDRRQGLHARIMAAIERLYAHRLAEQVDRLALHAFRGEVWDKAADYLYQAGAKAFGRSALREASTWYDQATTALDHLPQTTEVRARAIDIRFELRNAQTQIGDYRNVKEHLLWARGGAEALGDRRRLGQAYALLASHYTQTCALDGALDSGERALVIADALGNFGLSVMVSLHLGWVHCVRGDFQRAEDLLTKHLPALSGDLVTEHFGLSAPASVLFRSFAGHAQAELGAFTHGIPSGREGVRLAEQRGRPLDRAYAYRGLTALYLRQGAIADATAIAEQGLELAETNGMLIFVPWFASLLAWTCVFAGKLDRVPGLVERVSQTLALQLVPYQAGYTHSQARISAGEASLRAGRIEEASELARRALDDTNRVGLRGSHAWATWLLGETAMAGGQDQVQPAASRYLQALTEATELGMRPLIAHCHLGLGKLYRRTGRREQEREHLTTATKMYREMDMRFWLEQVKVSL